MRIDVSGIRMSKNGITYEYHGDKLRKETRGDTTIEYLHGANGIIGFRYSGTNYYYIKNAFGDVTSVIDHVGRIYAEYVYDAFGNCTITYDPYGIGSLNPIRYRSYYYDTETGLYYLKTRYYDPEIGRFISPADTSTLNINTVGGLNLYAYAVLSPTSLSYITTDTICGLDNLVINSYSNYDYLNADAKLPAIPKWVKTAISITDTTASFASPIRTAIATIKYTGLWDLMRLDGIDTLPGKLSAITTGIGYGISVLNGFLFGYENFAAGANLQSAIVSGIIHTGINIGIMHASSALATFLIGKLVAVVSFNIPGAIIVIGGAILATRIALRMNDLATKKNILGDTFEGHLNKFIDWLI